jgi:hypothetical protein
LQGIVTVQPGNLALSALQKGSNEAIDSGFDHGFFPTIPVGAKAMKTAFALTLSLLIQLFSGCASKINDPAGRSIARLPNGFEANMGLLDSEVKFICRGLGYRLYLTSTESILSLRRPVERNTPDRLPLFGAGVDVNESENIGLVRMKILGANLDPVVRASGELPVRSNYFIGADPARWHTNMPNYERVTYQNVYSGIDLAFYDHSGELEYDFVVSPGADPGAIRLVYDGIQKIEIEKDGDLLLHVASSRIEQKKPLAYQERGGVRKEIAAEYFLTSDQQVGFYIGSYDTSIPLIIDPVLVYSSYLGGSGGENGRFLADIAVDKSGNAYVTGSTDSLDFPLANPVQPGRQGTDAFVAKIDPTGSRLVYSTYIGGSGLERGFDIAVDQSGSVYITGRTQSPDFPTTNAWQTTYGGSEDAFVLKLSPDGSELLYATFLGGASIDFGCGIAVDGSGNAYVAASVDSANLPTTPDAVQPRFGGGQTDVLVAKLDPSGANLVFMTYLGGSGIECGDSPLKIALDSEGNAYVTTATASWDFPLKNPLKSTLSGQADVFVAKLNPSGTALVYSTYIGGSGVDIAGDLAANREGSLYLAGSTNSADFPVLNPIQSGFGGLSDGFALKINAAGSSLVYSTYLGGSATEEVHGLALDSAGCAYVTGSTSSQNMVLKNPLQVALKGANDAFVVKLAPSGSEYLYSTYLGGNYQDYGLGVAVDPGGNAYVIGYTTSTDFPTLNAFQGTLGGQADAFVTRISDWKATLELTLSGGSASAAATTGSGSNMQVGYAAATVTSGVTPYGVAVFSLRQNNIITSEAGVPASPPTTAARIFIDFRSSVPAIPGRLSAGTVNVNTGIAVVNYGSASATIIYTLRDVAGATIASGHGKPLAGGAHFAKFIDQLNEVAPDFVLPSGFQILTQFASLEVSSDQPLSILALRMTTNQRNEVLYTTTPIADLTAPFTNDSIFFPQFADGGGNTTSLILLNTSNGIEAGTLQILDNDGNPFVVTQVGGTAGSQFRYSIPDGGVFRFQTDGSPATTTSGWARLTPDAGTSAPIGAGVFGYNPGNFLVAESGVPSSLSTTHARVYVDLSGGHNTGLAIANLTSTDARITITALQSDGVTGIGTSQDPLPLPPNGHQAHFASEFVAGLPDGFVGVLDIISSTPFAALTLRSLNNERNEFLLATFPVADMTRAAPAPIVFPQIADGGGLATQFILIGAGAASSVTLNFCDEGGKPLAIGR